MKIIIDSREQNPLSFRKNANIKETVKKKLEFGDYSFIDETTNKDYSNLCVFERKNPVDALGTLGKGHKRFKKEIMRAKKAGCNYFCIIIECSYNDFINKNFDGGNYSNMIGDIAIKILNRIKFKYNIDYVFVNNRNEASSYIIRTFIDFMSYYKIEGEKKFLLV